MDWPNIRARMLRLLTILGAALAAIRWVLERYGELDTAQSAFENRGPVVDLIGAVVTSSWFGPVVAGAASSRSLSSIIMRN